MARKFSYPAVASLEVGQSALVLIAHPFVRRKVKLYAERNGKAFTVEAIDGGTRVSRVALPEPIAA